MSVEIFLKNQLKYIKCISLAIILGVSSLYRSIPLINVTDHGYKLTVVDIYRCDICRKNIRYVFNRYDISIFGTGLQPW